MQTEKQIVKEGEQAVEAVFNKKLIIKGSLWFALITICTIAGIFFDSFPKPDHNNWFDHNIFFRDNL